MKTISNYLRGFLVLCLFAVSVVALAETFKGTTWSNHQSKTVQQAPIIHLYGDIEDYLVDITYADSVVDTTPVNDPSVLWHERSDAELIIFMQAITALYSGNYQQAANKADDIGFQVIRYTDTSNGKSFSGKIYYLLQDTAVNWNAETLYPEGIFIFDPAASYPVIVQIPHPRFDSKTNLQGIGIFLEGNISGFFLAGVHRRNYPVLTSCKNAASSDYRKSDGAHNIEHTFQAAHVATQDYWGDNIYYLQLHGFGSSSYNTLANQCYPNTNDTRPDDPQISEDDGWLINISDTWRATGDPMVDEPPNGSFVYAISDAFDATGLVKTCVYNRDTSALGGTVNTQARYTNGVSNNRNDTPHVCSDSGGFGVVHTDHFIHVEQSYYLRNTSNGRDTSIQAYTTAISNFFD